MVSICRLDNDGLAGSFILKESEEYMFSIVVFFFRDCTNRLSLKVIISQVKLSSGVVSVSIINHKTVIR